MTITYIPKYLLPTPSKTNNLYTNYWGVIEMLTLLKTNHSLDFRLNYYFNKRLSSPEYDMLAASFGTWEFDKHDARHGRLNEDTEDALRDQQSDGLWALRGGRARAVTRRVLRLQREQETWYEVVHHRHTRFSTSTIICEFQSRDFWWLLGSWIKGF